jgi:hypothetical protein
MATFFVTYAFFCLYNIGLGYYLRADTNGRRRARQAVKYVYVTLKMLVAVAISPLLLLLFAASPRLFLPVFTFLWVHLDILKEDGSLYLRRWFMTPKRKWYSKWYRPRFLHLINQSDEGRDPHDHPNSFRTTILRGGYHEAIYYPKNQKFRTTYGLCHYRRASEGDTLDNPVGHTHMVTLIAPTWTWVVGWNGGGRWGFWVLSPTDADSDRWIDSEDYGAKGSEVKSWEIRT